MIKHLLVLMLVVPFALAADAVGEESVGAIVAEIGDDSIVTVSYHLRFDEGDAPYGGGWSYMCPNCGRLHQTNDLGSIVEEERTADRAGFLISPTEVVTSDSLVPLRFIERIDVHANGQSVPASIAATAIGEKAVRLTMERQLSGVTPLEFESGATAAHTLTRVKINGSWTTNIQRVSPDLVLRDTGDVMRAVPDGCILFDREGRPVGLSFNGEIAAEGWLGNPAAWAWASLDDVADMLVDVEAAAARQILHATLRFRSPAKDFTDEYAMYTGNEADDLEQHATAVVVDHDLLLVPMSLSKEQTARLEQIRIRTAGGATVEAEFAGSLKDYGALLVTAALPADHVPRLGDADLRKMRYSLIPAIELRILGEQEERRPICNRIVGYAYGFRDQIFPRIGGPRNGVLLFSPDGDLFVFPMARRTGPSEGNDRYGARPVATPVSHLEPVLEDLDAHLDPLNVPLNEEEENRIAWLGTEVQSLDAELARALEIADKTDDGNAGLMITYVYEGSPAQQNGLLVGDVLLRIQTEDEPAPIELVDESYNEFYQEGFPWEFLDELPEEYYDRIPTPWPPANGFLNELITELGAGNAFSMEYLRDGELKQLDMVVEYSPPYFRTAPRIEHEALGVTARDITYEARRYFQRTEEDPGVIISSLSPGSRASVAGLRPYEIITHVDDEPVMSVDDLVSLTADRDEVRLSVRRFNNDRIVSIDLSSAE
ncbi:MAG: hypothetical protein GY715_15245 [Planctomycetes bacterium]|nr:hypothetical protein [Planctomycetota bacterium]